MFLINIENRLYNSVISGICFNRPDAADIQKIVSDAILETPLLRDKWDSFKAINPKYLSFYNESNSWELGYPNDDTEQFYVKIKKFSKVYS